MEKSKDKKQGKKDKKDAKDKKTEKNKEKSPFIQNFEIEEHEEKPLEPYVCTGNFIADYEELCRRNDMSYVPCIVQRMKIPLQTVTTPVETKNEKTKNKGPVEVETEHSDENKEPLPKTYILNSSYEYFKPRIQVEMENKEKPEWITEIHIRGWKMANEYLNIFQQCWPFMEKLNTLNLWNTGLDGNSITLLASLLPKCANLKKLFLDAIHVEEENYGELLGRDSLIEYVSFRHCQMTSKGAESISIALFDKEAIKLTSLNLSGNFIGDQGAKHLADALRINRTLLVLGLSHNSIGDTGAKHLAEVISRFPLTQTEVVERRKLLAEKGNDGLKPMSPPVSRRSETRETNIAGSRGTPVIEKDKSAKKGLKSKKEAKTGKEGSGRDEEKLSKGKKDRDDKGGGGGGAGTGGSGGGGGGGTGGTKKGPKETDRKIMKNMLAGKGVAKTPGEVEIQSPTEPVFPLLEQAEYNEVDKQLWIPGNRMLKLLDLSRNKITSVGVRRFLDAMQYQAELGQDQAYNFFPGLLKIKLKKNDVSEDCEYIKELNKLMQTRDPFPKLNKDEV